MTINIKKDRIEFVSNEGTTFTLSETGDGFSFDGVIEGTNIFQDGFQGTVAGFTCGGDPSNINIIDKFLFATDSNAVDHGDLTIGGDAMAGQSSSTHGYTTGGGNPGGGASGLNDIQKFLFATKSNATDVGDLLAAKKAASGQSSPVSGYTSGGYSSPGALLNTIEKFPFATDTNGTDVGDITAVRSYLTGHSSMSSGYTSGGYFTPPVARLNTIEKFPFATDTNGTDVGDLTQARERPTSQSSSISGYTSGGVTSSPPPVSTNTIDKFPFSSDSNSTDVGDLSASRASSAGQSSIIFGYTSGGTPPATEVIDKFPFSSDSNATDVGDLTQGRYRLAGQQD